jgi:hypothetical protein
MNYSNIQFKDQVCIPIKSYTTDDIYHVSVLYDITLKEVIYSCTCGIKYGIGMRNKCKHISNIKSLSFKKLNNIDIGIRESFEDIDIYSIPIKSFNSNDNYYVTVKIEKSSNKVNYQCTCGDKHGLKRTKCKHISFIYINLLDVLNSTDNIDKELCESLLKCSI